MSKDPENFSNLGEIKKIVKALDIRTKSLEDKVDQILDLMSIITQLVENDNSDDDSDDERSDWNPYTVEDDFWSDDESDDSEF